ncbi:cardiac-enriched FHL2-interacting protein isoform X2 [Hippocampus comes]|uniref:cardiac-enriched FHL2-interacting protein isoform X2 n=1 Tax=Hippocampus comes TaxID=109280 RepID=UPI00094F36D4|nr:PREDICTED: uncharacterized protein C10orf71 homolog isoform X2 [Hippocampus comes]
MTSVEKRRSSRKNGGHRKHSDGGFSDTSSGGSLLDETDREVRSLTDKAFRSLCVGEEAIYNDSDLGPSSPCLQRDRQRAFSPSGLENEDGDREELKRTAHESFSLMVQQYEHDWTHDGMYGAELNRNPQWDVCGDGAPGRVSATFQHSLMGMTQEDKSLEEDPLSYFSNGATDLSLRHQRSRSRVSSLIRAFNSEGGAVMEDQLREWNDEARWNRPDLMNMPSPYQQNVTNGHFSMVGHFSSQDTNFYPTEAAGVPHMNAASSFMGLSHNNYTMMTQVDCNTNFFIHSEFSPFRVWRDHNRFQQGEVSRHMHCSEFPKWNHTPMYKELSLEPQMNASSTFQERSGKHHSTMMAPVVPNHPLQSISTSTRLQKASALEKRCESEQAVHYPHRMRTQSLGTNRIPTRRPSTASPTVEMCRHVQETLSSVDALHQQIKIMTEQNNNAGMTDNRRGAFRSNDTLLPVTTDRNAANQSSSTLSTDGHMLSPQVPMSQAEPPESKQKVGYSQVMEHPPVRAESRGAMPDVRMSSYKSRASSLLFNLKDNRKRVKSTYSPAKFKGCETTEKSRELPLWESKDIVIDIPEHLQGDIQESSWTDGALHQYVKPYHSPRLFSPPLNSKPNTGQVSDYKMAQRQHENDTSNRLTTGLNFSEELPLYSPFKQDVAGNQVVRGEVFTNKSPFNTTDVNWKMGGNNQVTDYLPRESTDLKEPDSSHSTEVVQLNQNKHNYSNASKEWWGPPNTPNAKQLALKGVVPPWKHDTTPLKEKQPRVQANPQTITEKQIISPRDDQRREGQQETIKEAQRTPQCNMPVKNSKFCGQDRTENYLQQNNHAMVNQEIDESMQNQETSQRKVKVCAQTFEEEMPKVAEQHNTSNSQNSSLSVHERTERVHQVKDGQLVEVKALKNTLKQIQSEQRQTEQSKVPQCAHGGHPKDKCALWQTGSVEAEPSRPAPDEITAVKVKLEYDGKQKDRTSEKPTRTSTEIGDGNEENNDAKVQVEQRREVQSERVHTEQADLEELQGKQRPLESERTQPSQNENNILDEVEAKLSRINQEGEQKMLEEVKAKNVRETVATQVNKEKALRQAKMEHTSTQMEAHSGRHKQNEKKAEKESQVNTQPKEVKHEAKEANSVAKKAELAKMELTNMELAKVALVKHQHMKQRPSKLTAIQTTQPHVKSEPTKVDQVKTELAKAKAELAKIKEKMKGDKKGKVRCTIITKKEGVAKEDAEVTLLQQTAQAQQHEDNSAAKIANNSNHQEDGADYYQSLREKYGFTHSLSHQMSSGASISSKDGNLTPSALPLDITEVNTNKSNDDDLTVSGEFNNNEKVNSNKGNESLYIYSKSSNEFKLSQADNLPPCVDKRATGGTVSDSGKEGTIKNFESSDPYSHSVVSQQTRSESIQNPETKHKSERQKAMPPKEKAQTKQEILTSKIKAHAEKEISALMEGFALQEVFTSKTATKPLPASQSLNLKHKPPSHDVLRGHGISISSSETKYQIGSSGMEDKALLSSEGIGNQTVNQTQKEPPMKSDDPAPDVATAEMKMTPAHSVSAEQRADHHEIRSPIQNEDQESMYSKENTVVKLDGNSEKPEFDSLLHKPDPPVGRMKSQQDESQHVVVHEDFACGQTMNSVSEDSLSIMEIIVTEKVNNDHKVLSAEEGKESRAEPDTSFLNSSTEMSEKSECLIHINTTHAKEIQPTEKETPNKVGMNIHHEKTIEENINENVAEKMASPLHCNINAGPQSEMHVTGPMPGKDVTPTLTFSSINKAPTETQLLQNVATLEMAGSTFETFDPAENCHKDQEEIKTKEIHPHLKQDTAKGINTGLNCIQDTKTIAETRSVTPCLEQDAASDINPSEISGIEDKSALLLEENRNDTTSPQLIKIESMNASSKRKESNTGITNHLEDVHTDNIVIRVVPAATESDSVEKEQSTTCSDVAAAEEHQHQASSIAVENTSASIKNDKNIHPTSEGCGEQRNVKMEDKLSVQDNVRKLTDSMKNIDQHNSMSINTKREDRGTVVAQTPISNVEASEEDYFQVQGIPGALFRNNSTHANVPDVSKGGEHSNQPSDQSTSVSSTKHVQNERMRKRGATEKNALKQSDRPSESQNCENMAAAQMVDVRKQHSDFRSNLSVRERHNSRNSQLASEESEVKSKPKKRVSTIPEISALADYARLKVIVSEDRENTIQEFPPHKKEGFFPLIQSRYARRPIFSVDPQEPPVKDKSPPKKTEVDTKVNKEPKPVVFPITEKEHQRTGMFKLGEKERREKTVSDVKHHEELLDKELQQPTQRKAMPKAQVKNEVNREEVPKVDGEIVSQQNNNRRQDATSSSLLHKARENPQSQQQKRLDAPNATENTSGLTSINCLVLREKVSDTKPTMEPIYPDGTSKIKNDINKDRAGERNSEKSRKENLDTCQEETKAKREQEESASKRRQDTIAEDIKARIEERRAFISEERKRAQREAARWEKLKETAQRMEEERKGKQIEGRRTHQGKDGRRTEREGRHPLKAQQERGESTSVGERNRLEQRPGERTAEEEEQMRAVLIEEQRLAKRIEQRRLVEETRIKKIQERMRDEQKRERQKRVEQMTREDKGTTRADQKPNTSAKPREAEGEELIIADDLVANREEEHFTTQRKKASTSEEQKRAALLMDALQYYTISSKDKKPKERQTLSPLQEKKHPSEPPEDSGSHRRSHGPHAPPSPAPPLPRSNTSSPALGAKMLMFRVKDNTRGSSFTKSVKPRFHKNFAEESRVGLPTEGKAERRGNEQEITSRNTGTPVHRDAIAGLNRLTPINESSVSQPASTSQEYSAPLPHHRPFSRRSVALDDDDSPSVISNMSEDVQSFATSAADVADLRGLYDYERPVSACSFSSDMSRLGKPPAVPPKSDKALRRAQRLTTRRIRKEVTQSATTDPAEKPQREASSRPASASTELPPLTSQHLSPFQCPPLMLLPR